MNSDFKSLKEVKRLLTKYVPETTAGSISIMNVVRNPGVRTIVAVRSLSTQDPISACLGPNNTRIKSICAEMPGECFDLILWSDSPERFIRNALPGFKIESVLLEHSAKRAAVSVNCSQEDLRAFEAEGRKALLSSLLGWQLELTNIFANTKE